MIIFLAILSGYSHAQSDTTVILTDTITDGNPGLITDTLEMPKKVDLITDTITDDNVGLIADTLVSDTSRFSQEKFTEIFSVEFSPGFSLPTGDFASGNYQNQLAGYAKEGNVIGAGINVRLTKYLHLLFTYSRQSNTFDQNAFAVNVLDGNNKFKLVSKNNWRNHFIMGGFSGVIKIDDNNFITPRVLFGYCLGRTPGYEIVEVKSAPITTITPQTIESDAAVSFAFRIGVSLKKYLNNHIYIALSPDFYWSTLPVNINQKYITTAPKKQGVNILSLSLSLGFRVYKMDK
ncbi:MAG: hypothetical protein AB7O73_11875 [Bacteroidia bacterium]